MLRRGLSYFVQAFLVGRGRQVRLSHVFLFIHSLNGAIGQYKMTMDKNKKDQLFLWVTIPLFFGLLFLCLWFVGKIPIIIPLLCIITPLVVFIIKLLNKNDEDFLFKYVYVTHWALSSAVLIFVTFMLTRKIDYYLAERLQGSIMDYFFPLFNLILLLSGYITYRITLHAFDSRRYDARSETAIILIKTAVIAISAISMLDLPYWYYNVTKVVLTCAFIYLGNMEDQIDKWLRAGGYILLICLFNPLVELVLTKEIWGIINLSVIGFILIPISIDLIKTKRKMQLD